MKLSVRISQNPCRCSDWTISMWHINPKWHVGAFHEKSVLFSSATIHGETFHFAKIFSVVWEEGPYEGPFEKNPAPPPPDIQNLTTLPSAPGDPIEADFSTPPIGQKTLTLSGIRGWSLMMTWNNPPIMFLRFKLLLLAHCLRDRYGGGMALISVLWYHRIIMILPSKWLVPPKPFLHRHITIMYPSQMAENIYSPINFHIYEGGRYLSVEIWISNTLFRSIYFNVHLIWIEEGGFCSVTPFDQDSNTFPYYLM